LEASYTLSKLLWTLIQGRLEPQIIHNRNFRWRTCYQYEFNKRQTFATGLSKQSQCHFWI